MRSILMEILLTLSEPICLNAKSTERRMDLDPVKHNTGPTRTRLYSIKAKKTASDYLSIPANCVNTVNAKAGEVLATENECRTKQRENQRGANPTNVKKNKFDLEDNTESIIGGVGICGLSICKRTKKIPTTIDPKGYSGWYEFNLGAQAHTTNELHRLIDKQPSTAKVIGHDRSITTPEFKGDIYLSNNGILFANTMSSTIHYIAT